MECISMSDKRAVIPVSTILEFKGVTKKRNGKPLDLQRLPYYTISMDGIVYDRKGNVMKYRDNDHEYTSITLESIGEIQIAQLLAFSFKYDEIKNFEKHNMKWLAKYKNKDCTDNTIDNIQVVRDGDEDETWIDVPVATILKDMGKTTGRRGKPLDFNNLVKYYISNKGRVKDRLNKDMSFQSNMKNGKYLKLESIGSISLSKLMAYSFKKDDVKTLNEDNVDWCSNYNDGGNVDIIRHDEDGEIWTTIPLEEIIKSKNKTHSRGKPIQDVVLPTYKISSKGRIKDKDGHFMNAREFSTGRKLIKLEGAGDITVMRAMAFSFKLDEVKEFQRKGIKWDADHHNHDCTKDTLENLNVMKKGDNVAKSNMVRSRNENQKKPILQINKDTGEFIKEWSSCKDAEIGLRDEVKLSASRISEYAYNHKIYKGFKWEWKNTDLEGEIWYDFKYNEKLKRYKWSNLGRICNAYGIKSFGSDSGNGNMTTNINGNSHRVHRLIAYEALHDEYLEYNGKCKEGEQPLVTHKDGNNSNNTVSNLMWATPLETHSKGTSQLMKPVECINTSTGEVFTFNSQKDAMEQLGISDWSVSVLANGHNKISNGYIMKYVSDNIRNIHQEFEQLKKMRKCE